MSAFVQDCAGNGVVPVALPLLAAVLACGQHDKFLVPDFVGDPQSGEHLVQSLGDAGVLHGQGDLGIEIRKGVAIEESESALFLDKRHDLREGLVFHRDSDLSH